MCLTVICSVVSVLHNVQSITGAMSTINPPVELEDTSKQNRLEYIQNIATQADFDYPQVWHSLVLNLPTPEGWKAELT